MTHVAVESCVEADFVDVFFPFLIPYECGFELRSLLVICETVPVLRFFGYGHRKYVFLLDISSPNTLS